jgi:outer membrane receptor protein involved in Fe transport
VGEGLETQYAPVSDQGSLGDVTARADVGRRRIAAFISAGSSLSSRLRVSLGTRVDRIEDRLGNEGETVTELAWSPRLGVTVRLGDPAGRPASLFLSLSRAFKAPTLDQRFDPRLFPDFSGGGFQVSNPQLRSQRARNLELGASGGSRRHRFQVLGYLMDLDDEIDFDVATYRYANIAESRHVGLELDGRLFVNGLLSPALSYAWSRAEPRGADREGLQNKNVPEHVLRPSLTVSLSALRLELRYTWLSGRYLDDDNRVPLADVSVLDLRLSAQRGGLRAHLDLLNLGDDRAAGYGFALPDLRGGEVAYLHPLPGFAARLTLSVDL